MNREELKTRIELLRPEVRTMLHFLLQPLAEAVTLRLAERGNVKPWQVTLAGGAAGVIAALSFLVGMNSFGALCFFLAVLLDVVDGKLARLMHNGSAIGILADAANDIARVIVCALAVVAASGDTSTALLMVAFVGLHFAEFLVNQDLQRVGQFWLRTTPGAAFPFESHMLNWSERFKGPGFKLIFIHYQERLFMVFVLGMLSANLNAWLAAALIVTILDLVLKFTFDLALIRKRVPEHPAGETG